MMAVCCGVESATAFCSACGKALRSPAPLEQLRSHLRTRVQALANYEQRLTKLCERAKAEPTWPGTQRLDEWTNKAIRTHELKERWQRWVSAVSDAIDTEGGDDGTQ